MAIQKVSDLPILRSGNQDFIPEKIKPSLIEISYKISSDGTDGVSRYQSMAITVAELANYIVKSQADYGMTGLILSGDVFLNTDVDNDVARNYQVYAKTGSVNTTALTGYTVFSPNIDFNGNRFTVKNDNQTALTIENGNIAVTSNANFTKQVLVPTIIDQT